MENISRQEYLDFYNKVGELYPEEELVYGTPSGILRREFVREKLRQFSGSPHLDVGCGGGIYLENVAKMAIGVDISHAVLKRARIRNPECLFVVADARELSFFRESTFESILLSEVIEHFENPELFFEGAHRLLKRGGRLIVTTPNYRGNRPQRIDSGVLKDYGIDHDDYLHTAYRPEELAKMAQRAGLSVLEEGTLEKELRYWYRAVSSLSMLSRFIVGKKLAVKLTDLVRNTIFKVFYPLGVLKAFRIFEGNRSFLIAQKA